MKKKNNNKMNCWLCEQGTGLDNGGLQPGELHQDFFGDMVCIYCESHIEFMGKLLANPELIPIVSGLQKLPRIDGVTVGLKFDEEEVKQ